VQIVVQLSSHKFFTQSPHEIIPPEKIHWVTVPNEIMDKNSKKQVSLILPI